MKICYIARHGQARSNDDEGSITYALEQLGHKVVCRQEPKKGVGEFSIGEENCDLVLSNHWRVRRVGPPMAFWYFDPVDFPDPFLASRSEYRRNWIADVTSVVDIGFCTDGDWVVKETTGKLHWLMQGADERVIGRGRQNGNRVPLFFYGTIRHGVYREEQLKELKHKYGDNLRIAARARDRVYRRSLANAIASADICIAPESPVTDRYWSNRVYVTLGFGGFLLHPYSAGLSGQYKDKEEIVFYRSREELDDLIAYYLDRPNARERISQAGMERTLKEHTYRHRCQKMMEIIEAKI